MKWIVGFHHLNSNQRLGTHLLRVLIQGYFTNYRSYVGTNLKTGIKRSAIIKNWIPSSLEFRYNQLLLSVCLLQSEVCYFKEEGRRNPPPTINLCHSYLGINHTKENMQSDILVHAAINIWYSKEVILAAITLDLKDELHTKPPTGGEFTHFRSHDNSFWGFVWSASCLGKIRLL